MYKFLFHKEKKIQLLHVLSVLKIIRNLYDY
jgi:hypothetical protein